MTKFTGSCLCEKIQYEVRGPIGTIMNCHCSECRRWHGAAFRTRASIATRDFFWTQGEDLVGKYVQTETLTKTFCRNCGSSLVSYYSNRPDVLGLALGTLHEDPGQRPQCHIFVGSKAPWFEITDSLPQYEEMPPDPETVYRTRNT